MEASTEKRDDKNPWLLITDGKQQYMYSISEKGPRFHPYQDPELEDMLVLASSYGWLVLSHPKTDDTFLWNPTTKEKIELGILKYSFVFNKCVMSKPPSEPDCNFVFFDTSGYMQGYCRLLGDQTMVSLSHPEGFYPREGLRKPTLLAAAAFRGTIYGFLFPDFRFVVLHFGDESVEFRPLLRGGGEPWDMPDSSCDSDPPFWEYHMIESEEELLLVKSMRPVVSVSSSNKQELDFRVFRVDVDRKECMELDNIGDRGIFISSRAGGFCCSSSDSSLFRRNCVYYTLEKGESSCVFVYDLNDRSNVSPPLLPCPDVSPTESECYWVQNQVRESAS